MEQAKRLNILKDHHHFPTAKNMKRFRQQSCSSWTDHKEEADFANDAIRGAQGGSIWPQRSYSCSFCKREFSSAQALGGHMNVHRRDRALLKQVITTHIDDHNDRNHMISRPSISKLPQNPPQVCRPKTSVAHLSLSRVSSSSVISGARKVISSTNDVVEAKMSLGLDLAVGTFQNEDDNLEEGLKSSKRFKKNGDYNVALFPFIDEIKCSNVVKENRVIQVPEILNPKASKSMEDLDLELRLGDSLNKVK